MYLYINTVRHNFITVQLGKQDKLILYFCHLDQPFTYQLAPPPLLYRVMKLISVDPFTAGHRKRQDLSCLCASLLPS